MPMIAKRAICLTERKDINNRPDIMAKSDNLIFTLVKIRGMSKMSKYPMTKKFSINTTGLCSFMYSIVFPCKILIK